MFCPDCSEPLTEIRNGCYLEYHCDCGFYHKEFIESWV